MEEDSLNKPSETKKISNRSKKASADELQKTRKKNEKLIENVIKYIPDPNEKITVLTQKCVELLTEKKNLEQTQKVNEKNISLLQRQLDQMTAEKNRQILINSRLQTLCRELQKQIKTEDAKRHEISSKFEATIRSIQNMMSESCESSTKLRDDNIQLNSKFETLCGHVEKREQQASALMKQIELERKLSEATIEQRNCELLALSETSKKEKEILLAELEAQKIQTSELRKTSENFKKQIQMYKEQCDDFHSVISKSNNMFGTFQSEMDKMAKKLHLVETENDKYQDMWRNANVSLIDVCRENQQLKVDQVQMHKQMQVLKDLCRTMQTERQQLYQKLEATDKNDELESNLSKLQVDDPAPDVQETEEVCGNDAKIIKEAQKNLEKEKEAKQGLDDAKFAEKQETLRLLKSSLSVLQGELSCIQKKDETN